MTHSCVGAIAIARPVVARPIDIVGAIAQRAGEYVVLRTSMYKDIDEFPPWKAVQEEMDALARQRNKLGVRRMQVSTFLVER